MMPLQYKNQSGLAPETLTTCAHLAMSWFRYFSNSDTDITSKTMRRVATVQTIYAYFFNTSVLALSGMAPL